MSLMSKKRFILITVVLLAFIGSASASKMTKMQKVKHASPLPSLMMVINMNANQLGLDNEQLAIINAWRNTHQQPTQRLVNDIVTLEQEMEKMVLEGVNPAEMKELKDDLLELRGELIDTKYKCVSTMQKTLDKEQWHQLMELRDRGLRVSSSDKRSGNEIQAFLRISPMPKLMAIILMHKKELKITKEQHKYLESWRLENMNKWALLFDQVLKTEKKITQQSLAMEDNAILMTQFDKMAKSRRIMAKMSLNCRDNMKKVLTEEQWQEVITLLKEALNN